MRKRLGRRWWERHYRLLVWSLFLTILILLLHAVQLRIEPVLRQAARLEGNRMLQQLIHEQVAQCLSENPGPFSRVDYSDDGKVRSVGLDVPAVNALKTRLLRNNPVDSDWNDFRRAAVPWQRANSALSPLPVQLCGGVV